MISDLVDFRITFAVAANVGQAIGRFRIGPKVRRLRHVIVFVAARRGHRLIDNRKRTFSQGFLRITLELCPGGGDVFISLVDSAAGILQSLRVEQEYLRRLINAGAIWLLANSQTRRGAQASQHAPQRETSLRYEGS